MLLEEYNTLEHVRQLTQLHSRLAKESTHNEKGRYDHNLDQLCIVLIVFRLISYPCTTSRLFRNVFNSFSVNSRITLFPLSQEVSSSFGITLS